MSAVLNLAVGNGIATCSTLAKYSKKTLSKKGGQFYKEVSNFGYFKKLEIKFEVEK